MAAPYGVPYEINFIHNEFPRYVASAGSLASATSAFSPNFDFRVVNDPYWGGIFTGAIALAATGMVLFLVLGVIYIITCVRRPKFRARLVAPPEGVCDKCCSCLADGCAKWCYVAAVALGVVLAIGSLAMGAGLKSATNGGINALYDIRNALTDADTVTRGSLSVQLDDAVTNAGILYDQAVALPAPQELLDLITSAQGNIELADAATVTVASQVQSATNAAWKGWDRISTYTGVSLDSLADHVIGWFAGAAAGYAFLSLLTLACLTGNKSASAAFRCLGAPFVLLWMLVVFLLLAALVVVSMAGSDACYDPNRAVSLLVNYTTDSSGLDPALMGPTVSWYAGGDCASLARAPPGSAGALLLSSQVAVVSALAWVGGNITAAVAPLGSPQMEAQVAIVYGNLRDANASLVALTRVLDCPTFHGLYTAALNDVCGEGVVAFIRLWAMGLVGCTLAIVAATTATRMIKKHPGDPDPRSGLVAIPLVTKSNPAYGTSPPPQLARTGGASEPMYGARQTAYGGSPASYASAAPLPGGQGGGFDTVDSSDFGAEYPSQSARSESLPRHAALGAPVGLFCVLCVWARGRRMREICDRPRPRLCPRRGDGVTRSV